MIAKVIAHGADREEALDRLSAALAATVVAGPKSNVAFLRALTDAPEFRSGAFDTGFIDGNMEALGAEAGVPDPVAVQAGALHLVRREATRLLAQSPANGADPWATSDAFQLLGERRTGMRLTVEGEPHEVVIAWQAGGPRLVGDSPDGLDRMTVVEDDAGVLVLSDGRQIAVREHDPFAVDLEHLDAGDSVKSPMHGKLIQLLVAAGDPVVKGQRLAVVEAMKMEHALVAPRDGEVAEVSGEPGGQVAEGARLVTLKAVEA
jgi:3-methylcrotonyl-CoA carboxylase alpha subunit